MHTNPYPSIPPIRPSETTDYLRCPKYWFYKHIEGWQALPSAWEPWQLMGSAVHAGLAAYWLNRKGRVVPMPPPKECAVNVLRQDWPSTAPPEFSRDGLESLALKVLDKTLAWIAKEMPDAQPVMVEQTLRADGCTPDLVTREPTGQGTGLVVTDWKTHWNLDPDKVRYRLEGLDRVHQFNDYAYEVGKQLGEPVALIRKVVIVGSHRIILRAAAWPPTPQALEYWLTSARQVWEDMSKVRAGERVASLNPGGCTMYGPKYPCTYWEACWTCHGDREQMAQFLVKEPRP